CRGSGIAACNGHPGGTATGIDMAGIVTQLRQFTIDIQDTARIGGPAEIDEGDQPVSIGIDERPDDRHRQGSDERCMGWGSTGGGGAYPARAWRGERMKPRPSAGVGPKRVSGGEGECR